MGAETSAAKKSEVVNTAVEPRSRLWLDARTLHHLGVATALWLEGETGPTPTRVSYDRVNGETQGLLQCLLPLNRTGLLVTTFSQPGCTPNFRPCGGIMPTQRAAISGFMAEPNVGMLVDRAHLSGLEASVYAPGSDSHEADIVVSRNDRGQDVTYTGDVMSAEEIQDQYGGTPGTGWPGLHPEMITALEQSWQVHVTDPEWGRNDVLWPMLDAYVAASTQG